MWVVSARLPEWREELGVLTIFSGVACALPSQLRAQFMLEALGMGYFFNSFVGSCCMACLVVAALNGPLAHNPSYVNYGWPANSRVV